MGLKNISTIDVTLHFYVTIYLFITSFYSSGPGQMPVAMVAHLLEAMHLALTLKVHTQF